MILSLPSAVIEKVSGPLSLIRGSDVIVKYWVSVQKLFGFSAKNIWFQFKKYLASVQNIFCFSAKTYLVSIKKLFDFSAKKPNIF
jgi:hypothetical protein